jgi:hypothetical protein
MSAFIIKAIIYLEDKDLVGEVLTEAHRSGIRVIGRYDFSRARKDVYDAHPIGFINEKMAERSRMTTASILPVSTVVIIMRKP